MSLQEPPPSTSPGNYVQYHCDYCRKDISNVVRIRCAVCTDFDLCIECFSVGVELGDHKNDHDYRVMENMHFPFLCLDWGADEEQLLLEGLEIYGMGNWEEIADHVSTKTKEHCKEHFEKYYMQSPYLPLPDLSHILSTREDVKKLNAGSTSYLITSGQDNISAKESRVSRASAKKNEPKPGASRPLDPDLSGYMPYRGEFEIEWDNEAESVIKDLDVTDEDDEETKNLKLRLLEIYNWKLDQREWRRNFVVKFSLHDTKKRQKKRVKEEQAIYNKTKKLLQVMTPSDYENLVSNLLQEKKLREKIHQLQEARSLGLRSLSDVTNPENKKLKDVARRTRSSRDERNIRTRAKSGSDISGKPGVELLSEKELLLCSFLKLYPQQYILVKEAILRDFLTSANGDLRKSNLKVILNLDANKSNKVFEFFEEAGWINSYQRQTLNSIANGGT